MIDWRRPRLLGPLAFIASLGMAFVAVADENVLTGRQPITVQPITLPAGIVMTGDISAGGVPQLSLSPGIKLAKAFALCNALVQTPEPECTRIKLAWINDHFNLTSEDRAFIVEVGNSLK